MIKKGGGGTSEPKRGSVIKYINSDISHVELPVYSGDRNEVMAPDTLDIQGMQVELSTKEKTDG